MEDLKVTAKARVTTSGEAHAAMQRYVDGNILSGSFTPLCWSVEIWSM